MAFKRNLALALVATGAAGAAYAQSSVSLFGIVDANVRYVNNEGAGSLASMNNSGLSSGRIGFRGMEDLGGGLKAGFWLESDVNLDTGTTSATGKFFQRRSTVSLISRAGEIRLGRDFTPASQLATVFDPFSVIGLANSNITSRLPGTFSNYYRHDNAVQYFSPNWGGFQGEVMYAMDESATTNTGRHTGARLKYENGPVAVHGTWGTTTLNAANAKLKQAGLGASYDFGVAKLMAYIQRDTVPFGTYGTAVAGPETRFALGTTVPVGRDQIRAAWVRTNSRGGTAAYNSADADKFSIGYVHNMSVRTAIYGTFSYINNKSGANFSLASGPAGLANGANSTGAEVGIRHNF